MCFVDIEKVFNSSKKGDGVDNELERCTRSNCKSGNEPAKIRAGSKLFQEFGVEVGVHQGCVLSLLLFAIVVNVMTKYTREVLNEIL